MAQAHLAVLYPEGPGCYLVNTLGEGAEGKTSLVCGASAVPVNLCVRKAAGIRLVSDAFEGRYQVRGYRPHPQFPNFSAGQNTVFVGTLLWQRVQVNINDLAIL